MLDRSIWFAAGKIVCLFTLIANAGAEQTPSHPIDIVASPSILPEGAKCRIELHPESISESWKSSTFYEGTIKGITKDKVLLKAVSIEQRCVNTSPLSRIPILRRYFKTTGVARSPLEESEVQIPVEKILSITLIEEMKTKREDKQRFPVMHDLP